MARAVPELPEREMLTTSGDEMASILGDILRSAPDVLFAYLFGSTVKGRVHRESDVDVAVWLDVPDPARDGPARLRDRAFELQGMIEREIRRPADVVVLNHAPLELSHNVLRHGRLIFVRDEAARKRFYIEHARRYHDLAPARAIFTRYMARRIQEGTFGGGSGNRS